jgi:hypothetical protein
MGKSVADCEKRERLAYIFGVLDALSGAAARDGSATLRSFVDLAAAQARDEFAALDKRSTVDSALRTVAILN